MLALATTTTTAVSCDSAGGRLNCKPLRLSFTKYIHTRFVCEYSPTNETWHYYAILLLLLLLPVVSLLSARPRHVSFGLVLKVVDGEHDDVLLAREVGAKDGLRKIFQDSWEVLVDLCFLHLEPTIRKHAHPAEK